MMQTIARIAQQTQKRGQQIKFGKFEDFQISNNILFVAFVDRF
jgi:hypothetical protein